MLNFSGKLAREDQKMKRVFPVSERGQVTLPKEVREALGLRPGDRVRYRITASGVRISRARSVMELNGGLARSYGGVVPLTELDEAGPEGASAEWDAQSKR